MIGDIARTPVKAASTTFAAVFDHGACWRALGEICRAQWQCDAPQEVRVRPLRAHNRRCTFDVIVHAGGVPRHLIGKVYAADRADVFGAMQAMARAGFGPDAPQSIPQAFVHLAFGPELSVRIEERAEGSDATTVFAAAGPAAQQAAAARCGQWLARFHGAAPPLGAVAAPESQLSRIDRWAEELVGAGGTLATRAATLRAALHGGAPHGVSGFRTGHGSFIPDHVLLDETRTAGIDLDEYDVADPGRDLAWFVVSLRRRALMFRGGYHALDAAVSWFLGAYEAAAPAGAGANLPFYLGMECLHRARRDVFGYGATATDRAGLMLDEGLAALA